MTLALTLPSPDDRWLGAFAAALAECAAQDDVSLVGGDTSRGPRSLALFLHGTTPETHIPAPGPRP